MTMTWCYGPHSLLLLPGAADLFLWSLLRSLPAHLRELVEPDETPRGSGMTELRSLFEMLDKDSNGKVSSKEWGSQIRRNQAALSKHFGGASLSEIGRKFRQVDADGDGSLSWEEVQQAALLASGVKPVPQAPKASIIHHVKPLK